MRVRAPCYTVSMRTELNELRQDIAYMVRGKTWRDVWAWFTAFGGARLFVAVWSVVYLLWGWL